MSDAHQDTELVRRRKAGPWEAVPDDTNENRGDEMNTCEAFSWVGQSFKHCDDCGQPYWDHTHVHGVGSEFGQRVPITPEEAERVKQKWGAR